MMLIKRIENDEKFSSCNGMPKEERNCFRVESIAVKNVVLLLSFWVEILQ
jgi:hypothetical protein